MPIFPLGLKGSDASPLFDPVDPEAFAEVMFRTDREVRSHACGVRAGTKEDDYNFPARVGWDMIIHPEDWGWMQKDIRKELQELSECRKGRSTFHPLLFDCAVQSPEAWWRWINANLDKNAGPGQKPRFYLLILGSPEKIPFGFQAELHASAAVGRVHFDTPEEYRTYLRKLIERAKAKSNPARDLAIFAPCHDDATEITTMRVAAPLSAWASRNAIRHERIIDARGHAVEATRAVFERLAEVPNRVVFAVGHGLGQVPTGGARLHGAFCCPGKQDAALDPGQDLISAESLDPDKPCFEGGVVVMQSCYGLGTPKVSTVAHWMGGAGHARAKEELSALPKRLLAHPRGPVAFIGHLDVAMVFGGETVLRDGFDPLRPFTWLLEGLFRHGQTVGNAMGGLRHSLMGLSGLAHAELDLYRIRHAGLKGAWSALDPAHRAALAEMFVRKNDVRHFLLLGDPAAV